MGTSSRLGLSSGQTTTTTPTLRRYLSTSVQEHGLFCMPIQALLDGGGRRWDSPFFCLWGRIILFHYYYDGYQNCEGKIWKRLISAAERPANHGTGSNQSI